MKTKTISAIKTYPIQQFVYDKIGLEDTFPSSVPDEECIKQLHERIEAMARAAYPWYFAAGKKIEVNPEYTHLLERDEAQEKITENIITKGVGIEGTIRQCTTLKELELYFKIIDKKPDSEEKQKLWGVYDEQYEKLQKQPA